MIDQRFALQEFVARGRNSPASDELAQQLQVAIAQELLPEVRRLAGSIAGNFGQLGHRVSELEFELEEQGGSVGVTFADPAKGPNARTIGFGSILISLFRQGTRGTATTEPTSSKRCPTRACSCPVPIWRSTRAWYR